MKFEQKKIHTNKRMKWRKIDSNYIKHYAFIFSVWLNILLFMHIIFTLIDKDLFRKDTDVFGNQITQTTVTSASSKPIFSIIMKTCIFITASILLFLNFYLLVLLFIYAYINRNFVPKRSSKRLKIIVYKLKNIIENRMNQNQLQHKRQHRSQSTKEKLAVNVIMPAQIEAARTT